MNHLRFSSRFAIAALAVLLSIRPHHAVAQFGIDFRDAEPSITIGAGMFFSRAEGEVFDLLTRELTLSPDDFRAQSVGAELGLLVGSRVELALGALTARSSSESRARAGAHPDGRPIQQTTDLTFGPLVYVGGRIYLAPEGGPYGRRAGHGAPWNVSAGLSGGWASHRMEQRGEFLDVERNEPFQATFDSAGTGYFTALSVGGVHRLGRTVDAVVETRYQIGETNLSRDFRELDRLDLDGFNMAVGVAYRF